MRILTWNVWGRFGPWEQRRKAILAVLRELRPDVVGLQEVWEKDGENLAEWLADELGLHWTWEPTRAPQWWQRRIGDPAVGFGNAVLSRWPVADRAVAQLPPLDETADDGRLVLYARLAAPGQDVPFFTTHLSSPPSASAVRCAQVAALAAFVAERRAATGTAFPPVVTGDFNAVPDSDEIRLLGGYRTAPAVPGQVLLDAWEYAEPGAASATWDAANPYVAPTHDPSCRIDYVHVGPCGPGGLGAVRSVRRAGDGPVDGVWPSDHAAVVADLAVPDATAR
ncbi:metal-dependent hydrolase [Streptomyces aureoverticillatus]|nr:metal-dependent hydrolase [Streptomyces aureoverticillatus]